MRAKYVLAGTSILVAAVMAAGAAFVFGFGNDAPGTTVNGTFSPTAALESCIGTNPSEELLVSKDVESCVETIMKSAVDAGMIAEIQEVLAAQIEKTPVLYQACHTAGHRVGQYAYSKTKDAGKLLRDSPTVACEYGYGHGVIDGLADQNPTPEEFASAIQACNDYLEGVLQPQIVGGYCSDGTGHAAWWSTRDLVKAMEICRQHRLTDGKSSCVGGVVMEMYEPVGFLHVYEPERAIAEGPTHLPEMCAEIENMGDQALSMGCSRGAAYVFTRPAFQVWSRVLSDTISDADRQAAIAETVTAWQDGVRHCDKVTDPAQCVDAALGQMPPSIADGSAAQMRACSILQGDWRSRCEAARFDVD